MNGVMQLQEPCSCLLQECCLSKSDTQEKGSAPVSSGLALAHLPCPFEEPPSQMHCLASVTLSFVTCSASTCLAKPWPESAVNACKFAASASDGIS